MCIIFIIAILLFIVTLQLTKRRQATKPKATSAATEAALKEVKSRGKKSKAGAAPRGGAIIPKNQKGVSRPGGTQR
jgi:hypothetical protein